MERPVYILFNQMVTVHYGFFCKQKKFDAQCACDDKVYGIVQERRTVCTTFSIYILSCEVGLRLKKELQMTVNMPSRRESV